MNNVVDPLNYKLSGSSLIEASAGTGKTWTIAALYVRMVLGHGGYQPRLPEDILVLTFTKAAAQELKDRIRARLSQAANYFFDFTTEAPDQFLIDLKNSIPVAEHKSAANLLDLAAQSMDQSSISTIHAWCQKVLVQHAFASASLFEQELLENIDDLKQQLAWDYWRVHVANLPLDFIAIVNKIWSGPDQLTGLVQDIQINKITTPSTSDIKAIIGDFYTAYQQQKDYWQTAIIELDAWFEKNRKNLKRANDFVRWLDTLRAWLADDGFSVPDLKTGWDRLSAADLQSKYDTDKISICAANHAIEQLKLDLAALETVKINLNQHALYHLSSNLQTALAKHASLDFNGLLSNLYLALKGQNGAVLAQTLRQQYPVVLIDEFQDTDPIQYGIFDHIYHVAENLADISLVFIGDPKQSIYGFRNADIYTYLQAVDACKGRVFTLDKNYRSVTAVVAGVNKFFSLQDKPVFITGQQDKYIDFHSVKANGLDEKIICNDTVIPAIQALQLANPGNKAMAVGVFRELAAQACAIKISNLLYQASQQQTMLHAANESRPVAPADIAVLVNTHAEASLIKDYLARYKVRSVFLSERNSVYASPQAIEIKLWLEACIDPQNASAVRAALASITLNLSLEQLDSLNYDELLWDSYIEKFIQYRQIWQYRGVLPMIHKILHDFAVPARLLANGYAGERQLTDLLHLAELLQSAATKLDGKQALLNYYVAQIQLGSNDDATKLRLESDDNLVKIITIHKSKGLEYPLVFLPFVCSSNSNNRINFPKLFDFTGEKQWLFELDAQQKQQYELNQLGEDIRRLYVALTRARHSVWMVLADVNSLAKTGINQVLDAKVLSNFKKLASEYPELFALDTADIQQLVTLENTDNQEPVNYQSKTLEHAVITGKWWISSYSALEISNIYSKRQFVPDTAVEDSLHENLTASQIEQNQPAKLSASNNNYLLNIPKGALTGVFLHSVLQWAAERNFRDLEHADAYIRQRCLAMAWDEHIAAIQSWFAAFVANSWQLDNGQQLDLAQAPALLAEMEFLLPVNNVDVSALDQLISQNFYPKLARPLLSRDLLNGMFKGFIDLSLQAEDQKFYIIDYKSNYLGEQPQAYQQQDLIKNMLAMRYDVQMLMYLLAMHRQLRARLPDYDYDRDLGGAVYMYLRGQNSPGQGLVYFKPDLDFIEALDQLVSGQLELQHG